MNVKIQQSGPWNERNVIIVIRLISKILLNESTHQSNPLR